MGITPAYAGTTLGLYLQMRLTGDHPCICGDYNNSLFSSKYNLGSPLHMRGLPQSHLGHPLLQGITPAYAGTTAKIVEEVMTDMGSPLHMRGLLLDISFVSNVSGITPAYAGTTCQIINPSIYTRDHPCICGDYCKNRGRGYDRYGITPAYAGTTNLNDWQVIPV